MKKEISKLKTIKEKYYDLEKENEKNKNTIDELNKEINILTSLNKGHLNNNIKEEKDTTEMEEEIKMIREENKDLKEKLLK